MYISRFVRWALVAFWIASISLGFAIASTCADELVRPVELAVYGGFADGPGFAAKAPTAGASLETGPRWLRLTASGGWTGLTKTQTPGGRQVGGTVGGKIYVGPFFVTGGFSHNFTDQTVWTKTVQYAYAGGGYRWPGKFYNEVGDRKWLNQVAVTYWRETYSTYANDTTIIRFVYTGNRRIRNSPWFVRIRASISPMFYNDNPYPGAERREGLGASLTVGLALMP